MLRAGYGEWLSQDTVCQALTLEHAQAKCFKSDQHVLCALTPCGVRMLISHVSHMYALCMHMLYVCLNQAYVCQTGGHNQVWN